MAKPRLVFVYAADSGVLNIAKDVIHKLVSSSTYPCHLCAITWGTVLPSMDWVRFVRRQKIRVQHLHRDQFQRRYPAVACAFPAVLYDGGGSPELLVTAPEVEACPDANALAHLVEGRLRARTQAPRTDAQPAPLRP